MRSRAVSAFLLGGTFIVVTACATSEQWGEWGAHSSHFASGQHLTFSLRNRNGPAPRVTQRDLDAAGDQNWWGEAVIVKPEQIFRE
ncbi:MAG: hypothetical protein ACE5JN_14300 [Candidatus Methylomirabilia bacterium]